MNIIKCKICNEEINDISIGMHLKHKHNITSEEYYLKYIKNEKGKCICGKETKFISILRGYKTYCSPKCARNDPIQIKHREETCLQKYGVKCSFAIKTTFILFIANHRKPFDNFHIREEFLHLCVCI